MSLHYSLPGTQRPGNIWVLGAPLVYTFLVTRKLQPLIAAIPNPSRPIFPLRLFCPQEIMAKLFKKVLNLRISLLHKRFTVNPWPKRLGLNCIEYMFFLITFNGVDQWRDQIINPSPPHTHDPTPHSDQLAIGGRSYPPPACGGGPINSAACGKKRCVGTKKFRKNTRESDAAAAVKLLILWGLK